MGVDCSPPVFIADESAKECQNMVGLQLLHSFIMLRCFAQGRKWIGIATTDALTELVIMAIPIAIVCPLKMSTKLKFQASSAFLFRVG